MPDETPRAGSQSTVRRAYRSLLHLLPFEFRAEFGRDIEQAFSDEHEHVRARRSAVATLRFWLRTARDLGRTAPREHWDVLRQDVRVGARLLTRRPGFAAAAMLTLALGIGGSTSIFAVAYAVVLRPLAFPESERVVRVGWLGEGQEMTGGLWSASYGDLQAIREKGTAFETIGGIAIDSLSSESGTLTVLRPDNSGVAGVGPSIITPRMASASIFRIFGASAVLGRLPDERDEQPESTPVAVLSYATWASRYGRDPAVVGRTLVRTLSGGRRKAVTIIGVLAPGALAYPSNEAPAWSSLDPDLVRSRDRSGREFFNLWVYARLAPGASVGTAGAEVAALTPYLAAGLPDHLASTRASLRATLLRDEVVGRAREPLLAFLGAVSCLLLLASVNVASLVLARAMSRRQEFAARFALGARPLRVARQLITESGILAIAGGSLGLALAWFGVRAFVAVSPSMPRLDESGIGAPALAFALGGILLAACVTGLVPALQASRRSVADGLRRAGGASATSTVFLKPLATLAAAQVALVLVLLAGAGLLVNSFTRLTLFDLGFDSRSIVMITIERPVKPSASPRPVPRADSQETVAVLSDQQRLIRAIDDEVIRRVSAIPGVAAAGLTGDDPFGPPYRYGEDIQIGEAAPKPVPDLRIASPDALETLDMRVTAGRWFAVGDREGTPLVAVVNQTMARRFWSGRSPIGDRIVYGRRVLHIVGIVADVRGSARQSVTPTFYVSSTQMLPDPIMLVVRMTREAKGVENAVAAELALMGDGIRAGSARRLEDVWWRRLSDDRFLTLVVSVFGLLALGIALVGVHGILRFLVAQRMRDLGIRKALGATRFDLIALVLGHALRFAIPGCVAGLIAATVAAPAMRSLLFGITPADPLTLAAATGSLLAAVLIGAYFPARRASAVDPALSLRCE